MKEEPTANTIDGASLIVIALTVLMMVGQIFTLGFLIFTHRMPEDRIVRIAAIVAPGEADKAPSSAVVEPAESRLVMKHPQTSK